MEVLKSKKSLKLVVNGELIIWLKFESKSEELEVSVVKVSEFGSSVQDQLVDELVCGWWL